MNCGSCGQSFKLKEKTPEQYIEDSIASPVLDSIKAKYNEPHRFYHNWDHVLDLVEQALVLDTYSHGLLLSIIFHDVIYDPRCSDNEEKSVEYFNALYPNNKKIEDAILNTKSHLPSDNIISDQLNQLDMSILYRGFKTFVEYEHKIFKEFQYVDCNTYKKERIRFLKTVKNIEPSFIEYVENRKYNIGLYAGSFNPFHKGHLDILRKAEQIFDKVIIARGINLSKGDNLVELPSMLNYHQIEKYDGLLTDLIDSLGHDVTLIRGLRNAADFEYEKTQYRFLKDLKPDIKVISIISEPELEHISSSAIRTLEKYNKGKEYKV
jgi:pantetheine-phosphate adenylyltransferase